MSMPGPSSFGKALLTRTLHNILNEGSAVFLVRKFNLP
jgi:nicotinamide riboside kinase